MRNVLVLGGTAWLGAEIACQFLKNGDSVTCLARGESGRVPNGAIFVQADRRSADGYRAVADRSWDEVVELSCEPALVRGALGALADRAGHWTLVSSVSVYATNSDADADESATVVTPTDPEDYGQAKVAAEQASQDALHRRLLIVRPGLIAGPGDGTDRFGYWVGRFALAGTGPVLSPTPADRAVQVIDVEDLAVFIARASGAGVTGVVNAVGESHALADVLALAADVAGFKGDIVAASDAWLVEHGARFWAGPRSLPLWLPRTELGFARRNNTAFRTAGGHLRDLRETVLRTLEAERGLGLARERRSGLSRAEELDLLDQCSR